MKYGLSDTQLAEIIGRLKSYEEIETVVLFGSRAIDTFKEASDVDIALKGEKVTAALAAKVKFEIEEESYLPFFFDVLAYPTISNEALKRHIDTKGVVIYRRGVSEWRECKFSEIIELIGGGTPKTSILEYWNGEIPWLSVVDFNNSKKYVFDTEKKITKLGLENSSTKLLNAGDIIISARGTVGVVAVLSKEMTFNQSCYGIRGIAEKSITDFIYYLLRDSVSNLKNISHGAVFDTITRDTFNEIDILLPPLPEQKAIAAVLSSLDDKIDLLHRQNKTLEAMAEILFKQWFVVEAREDWEEKPLGNVAIVQNGFAFSSKDYVEYQDGHLEVFKMGHIKPGGGLRFSPKADYVPRIEKLERWTLKQDDIVMAMTDMKDSMGILGHPAMIDISNKYVLNQRVARIYLENSNNLLSNYFLYLQLNTDDAIALLQSKANSGVQVNLSTEAIKSLPLIIPPKETQKQALKSIEPMFKKVLINRKSIKNLETLRDNLLPKLMNGEVRIKW